ncbi:PREDICTED: uncharacterized protein LOC108565799 [Nicrophorus vespilloides]|uniref:Uncharacterized protein LOC108565799 n=1 Tax=Nicrophorus vespilloides TaxID=110193 RepID=A0ABM1N256_NICVS|nr:PREDICTED: uncharacterized protein LOC108565799 [Nicrophorus vespilloides]
MYVLSGFGALLFIAILTCCTSTDTGNTTEKASSSTDLAVVSRGMKSTMYKVIPYLLVPALAMAGIMPWILPGIQLAVTMVTMLNNMAFSSALFMLIRNYIFNTKQEEHIVYVNHGYKNKHKHR